MKILLESEKASSVAIDDVIITDSFPFKMDAYNGVRRQPVLRHVRWRKTEQIHKIFVDPGSTRRSCCSAERRQTSYRFYYGTDIVRYFVSKLKLIPNPNLPRGVERIPERQHRLVVLVPFFVPPIGDQGQRGDREDEYLLNPVKTLFKRKRNVRIYIFVIYTMNFLLKI
jgi:hypothetical protein